MERKRRKKRSKSKNMRGDVIGADLFYDDFCMTENLKLKNLALDHKLETFRFNFEMQFLIKQTITFDETIACKKDFLNASFSPTNGAIGPGGSKDVDGDTNTVYRVDAPGEG